MSIGSLIRKLPSPVKDTLKEKLYPAMLREGETVPEWTLQSWDGQWYRHKNHKWTIMVFYPGDMTPGCTAQLQDFQNHYEKLKELGAEVFAVNPAEEESHREFAEMHGFEFPILTDRGGVVARQFAAAAQFPLKTIIIRSVYLINPQRKIRLANRGTPSVEAIVRSIEALQQATKGGM